MKRQKIIDACMKYTDRKRELADIVSRFLRLDEKNCRWLADELEAMPSTIKRYGSGASLPRISARTGVIVAILKKLLAEQARTMMTKREVRVRDILNYCAVYFDDPYGGEVVFRRILTGFLELDGNPNNCNQLAEFIGVAASTVIEFTMDNTRVPNVRGLPGKIIREGIVKYIQVQLLSQ